MSEDINALRRELAQIRSQLAAIESRARQTWVYPPGQAAKPEVDEVVLDVEQAGHGFAVGNLLKMGGIGDYEKALADVAANTGVIGMVSKVVDNDNFKLTLSGYVTGLPAMLYATGSRLYLDYVYSGKFINTIPPVPNMTLQIGYVIDSTSAVVQFGSSTNSTFYEWDRYWQTADSGSVAISDGSGGTLSLTLDANSIFGNDTNAPVTDMDTAQLTAEDGDILGMTGGLLQFNTPDFFGIGEYTSKTVIQANAFAACKAVYCSGADTYALADNTDPTKCAVAGFTLDTTGTFFTLVMEGFLTGFSGLTAGKVYYLGTAGGITLTMPLANVVVVGVAVNATTLVVNVTQNAKDNQVAVQVKQATHGFTAVGTVLKRTATGYAKAQADTLLNAQVVGVVGLVIDADNFVLVKSGYIANLPAITSGVPYYLSAASAGALVSTPPAIAVRVLNTLTTTTAMVADYAISVPSTTIQVYQASHTFVVGNVLKSTGANTYAKAQADTAANAVPVGIVSEVVDTDNFILTLAGSITGLSGLSSGTQYFLSGATAGAYVSTAPTIQVGVFKAINTTSVVVNIQPLSTGGACTVLGRSANSVGERVDIAAGGDDQILGRRSGVLTWAKVALAEIADLAGISLLGRSANSTGVNAAITGAANQVLACNGTPALAFSRTITLGDTSNAGSITIGNATSASAIVISPTLVSAAGKVMSVREIDVCDAGVAKKMLVLASAPY